MGLIELLEDYNIPYSTTGKNTKPGWVNVQCPFCGDTSNHLGIHIENFSCHCWKCGGHSIFETLQKLLSINSTETSKLLKQHKNKGTNIIVPEPEIQFCPYKRPSGVKPLMEAHKKYLIKRGFDPDYIVEVWNVEGTGTLSKLDNVDYKYRLFIPIYWKGKEVSFQTRDITGKSNLRYKACVMNREVIHHKHIIYRHPDSKNDVGICVEGVTDVWKLGKNSFATFGIEFTSKQVREIANLFKKVFLIYDPELQAQAQALKLSSELQFRGVKTVVINDLDSDPGSMSQKDANYLVREILKR